MKETTYMDLLPDVIIQKIHDINTLSYISIIRNAWLSYIRKREVSIILLTKLNLVDYFDIYMTKNYNILNYCTRYIGRKDYLSKYNHYSLYNEIIWKILASISQASFITDTSYYMVNDLFDKFLGKLGIHPDDIKWMHKFV